VTEIRTTDAPDRMGNHPKYGIASIATGMQLIDVLANADGPLKLKEIAAASGMPAAKVHRYLSTFIACGMVSQSGRSAAYDLGPMAMRVGVAALQRQNVLERACTELAALRDEIRATCFVSGWSDRGPIILRWEDSRRPLTVIVQVGSTMPLLRSATGRTFLGFLPRSQTAALVESEIAEANQRISSDELDALVRDTRAAGLGSVDGAFQEGIASLAVPLFDILGDVAGAVTALGRSGEFDASIDGGIANALRRFARQVEQGAK